MSTKKNNAKKFKLEMFEAVNLTAMSKIIGGTGLSNPGDGDDNPGDDTTTVGQSTKTISTRLCETIDGGGA